MVNPYEGDSRLAALSVVLVASVVGAVVWVRDAPGRLVRTLAQAWRKRQARRRSYENFLALMMGQADAAAARGDGLAPTARARRQVKRAAWQAAKKSPYGFSAIREEHRSEGWERPKTTVHTERRGVSKRPVEAVHDTRRGLGAAQIGSDREDRSTWTETARAVQDETMRPSHERLNDAIGDGRLETHTLAARDAARYEAMDSGLTTAVTLAVDRGMPPKIVGPDEPKPLPKTVLLPSPKRWQSRPADNQVEGAWESNPNAAPEMQRAEAHPMVAGQYRKIIEHLSKSGVKIRCNNETMARMATRHMEIEQELSTGHERSIDRFVRRVSNQLLRRGSFLLVRQRTQSTDVPLYFDPVVGREMYPVWGMQIPDMATVEAFVTTRGHASKWRQKPEMFAGRQNPKVYRDADCHVGRLPVHDTGLYFWTPSLIMPALYPIGVSRDLHETIERHSRNLVDMKYAVLVGSKDYRGGRVTRQMIDKVVATINAVARGGTGVFPWYTDFRELKLEDFIEALTNAGGFWDLMIRRVIGGSSLSDGDGGTSNRNTADTLTEADRMTAAMLIPEIQLAFRFYILPKFFEWGGTLDDLESWGDMPYLDFTEVDVDAEIKKQTHATLLWTSNAIPHEVYMRDIKKEPDPRLVGKYFFDIQKEVQLELAEVQGEIDAENAEIGAAAKAKALQTGAPAGGGGSKKAGTSSNAARPKRRQDGADVAAEMADTSRAFREEQFRKHLTGDTSAS